MDIAGGSTRVFLAVATAFAFAAASLPSVGLAQEGDGAVPSPPLPALQAPGVPVSFATQDGLPQAFPVPVPPPTPAEMSPPAQSPIAVTPVEGARNPASAVSVSNPMERSRVITAIRPERVPVFPEDPESAYWEINPHYAFARAQREQRPLLLLFTGMWNTQAMSLSEEVFATKSFNEYVKEHLVICYLNYERNFTDNPDALRRIREKFNVRGYPNVLIFNPNGEVESALRGYRSGRPVDYFNRLKAACQPVLESVAVQKSAMMSHGYREWSNYLGRNLFAKFLEHDGRHVRLGDLSGTAWIVQINDLAPEDQRLVESFPAGPEIEIEEVESSG